MAGIEPFYRKSFVDNTKMRKILHTLIKDKEIKRKISI
jgi:hypothetical protein